jgi:hypothetical protein
MKLLEEKLLRFAAPNLYKKMLDVFSSHHIHFYDVHATVSETDDALQITLRFCTDFSETFTQEFNRETAAEPDDLVTEFFEEAAQKCKGLLVADYYKMMKP